MSVEEMYEDFRSQYPEWTKSADARHIEILGAGEAEGAFLWFESLASALNAQMGIPEKRAEISVIFRYFEKCFCIGSNEVKKCIDVSFVENLFWDVRPNNAIPAWADLPKKLQQLYVDFHSQPPKLD